MCNVALASINAMQQVVKSEFGAKTHCVIGHVNVA